jgi:hypothetical protein
VQTVPVTIKCSMSPKTEDVVGTGGIKGAISSVVASCRLRALPSKAKGVLKRLGGFLEDASRKTRISITLVGPASTIVRAQREAGAFCMLQLPMRGRSFVICER